jgi:hypothetical protein
MPGLVPGIHAFRSSRRLRRLTQIKVGTRDAPSVAICVICGSPSFSFFFGGPTPDERLELFRLDPFDLRAAGGELLLEPLIAAVEVIDAVDGGLALGGKAGQDQRH